MRALLILVAIVVLVGIVGVATGFINLSAQGRDREEDRRGADRVGQEGRREVSAAPVRGRGGPWAIVAAILLPPLGVWLSEGLTPFFWIAAVLTLLAFVPGMLFALFAVLRPRLA